MMQTMRVIIRNSSICESFVPNSVYTQCIRWKRKPIWLPPAKSTMFRIPKRRIPGEDYEESKRLYNIYRTKMSSLRFYIDEAAKENEEQFDEKKLEEVEEEDFQACSAINDEWNAEVAKMREVRLATEREQYKEKVLKKIVKVEEKMEHLKKQADEKIKKAKEESVTFITAENIDAVIEECLANVVNYNRAMDLNGNWYEGKYPTVPAVEEVTTQTTTVVQ